MLFFEEIFYKNLFLIDQTIERIKTKHTKMQQQRNA